LDFGLDDYKRLLFFNQLSIHLIFSVSAFEWVLDGLIFNENFQSKVENLNNTIHGFIKN
jgi:hypothetical protein